MYSRILRNRLLRQSRLERAKKVLEATSVIGRTLLDAMEPDPKRQDQAAGSPDEEVVEGTFHVVDPETETDESDQQVEVTILARPPSGSPRPQPATTQLIIPPVPVPEEQVDTGQSSESPAAEEEESLPASFFEQLQQWLDKIPIPQPASAPGQTPGPDTAATEQEAVEKEAENEQFRSGTYTSPAGSRGYKLYVPSSYQGQPMPLMVMLHGCTQSPDSFAASTRMNEFAEDQSFFVVYPAQTFKANFGKCWNWFKESEQQRDLGEPAIIAGLTRQIIDTYGLDARRVYVAGISAGGAMAMVMGTTYPDLYAATGIQSGVAYGMAHNIPTGLAAIKGGGSVSMERLASAPGDQARLRVVPTIVFHGDQDSIVYPDNSDQIIAQWIRIHAAQANGNSKPQPTVHRGQVDNGHAYTRTVYFDEDGPPLLEKWLVHGAGHAWSGGNPDMAWTDAKGPNATEEMLRFFYQHSHPKA